MNKKRILVIAALLLIPILAIAYIETSGLQSPSISLPLKTATSTTNSLDTKVEINFTDLSQIKPFGTFINPSTNDSVVFKLNSESKSRNPGAEVYVNDIDAGSVGGQGLLEHSFSPNNQFFAARTLSVCGASCNQVSMDLVDIKSKKAFWINYPQNLADFKGMKSGPGLDVEPYIESFSWNGDSSLKIIFSFIAVTNEEGKVFRVSDKQEWNYNPISKEYSFVGVL